MSADGAGLIAPGHLFSQHSLATFVRCPRRFLLKYVDRQPWPVPETNDPAEYEAHLLRGRIFHQWMVRHQMGLPMDRIAACCPDPDLARWWQAAQRFPWHALPSGLRVAEMPVVAPLGTFRLYARYDLVALDPEGEAVVVDWKTLETRPHPRTLRERMQTRIYLYTLVALGDVLTGGAPVAPSQASMLYWFTNYPDEPATVRYSRDDYERDGATLTALAERIAGMPREEYLPSDDPLQCARCNYRTLCNVAGADLAMGDAPQGWLDEELAYRLDLDEVPELEY